MKINGWLCLICALGAIVQCSHSRRQEPSSPIEFAIQSSFNNAYDPAQNHLISYMPFNQALHAKLFDLDEELKPVPMLIAKYEQAGATVFFTLKENLRFSDGSPLTATDAVWSIMHAFKNTDAPNPIYRIIKGGEDYFTGRSATCDALQVLNERMFKITFQGNPGQFARYLCIDSASILPRASSGKPRATSGLYRVEKEDNSTGTTRVFLTRNPYYFAKSAKTEKLVFHFFPLRSAMLDIIKSGAIDMFINFGFNVLPDISSQYQQYKSPLLGGFYLILNNTRGELRRNEVRRLIADSIDSYAIIREHRWPSIFSPSSSILPYGFAETAILKPLRKASATSPLAQPITISCMVPDTGIRLQALQWIQQKLHSVRIYLDIKIINSNDFWTRYVAKDFDMIPIYYTIDDPTPIYFYKLLFLPGWEFNFNNSPADALYQIKQYDTSTDAKTKILALSRLEDIARNDATVIPVFNIITTLGYKHWIKNVRLSHIMTIPWQDIYGQK